MALMGTFVAAPLMAPTAQADPPRNAPAYGRRAKDKGKKYDKRNDKRRNDKRRNDKRRANGRRDSDRRNDKRRDNDRRDVNRRDRYEREIYSRDRYDRDRDYRDRYDRDRRNDRNNATYAGIVTDVRRGVFDVRANGRIYNVYVAAGVPRGLDRGDEVRLYGRPYGVNDIRNASVRVTRGNRDSRGDRYGRDDRGDDYSYGPYRTYNGVVSSVDNSRQFDVRIGGQTYNVYADNSTRGLSRGDEVRVYGRRYGVNDIRNSSVRITRNR